MLWSLLSLLNEKKNIYWKAFTPNKLITLNFILFRFSRNWKYRQPKSLSSTSWRSFSKSAIATWSGTTSRFQLGTTSWLPSYSCANPSQSSTWNVVHPTSFSILFFMHSASNWSHSVPQATSSLINSLNEWVMVDALKHHWERLIKYTLLAMNSLIDNMRYIYLQKRIATLTATIIVIYSNHYIQNRFP